MPIYDPEALEQITKQAKQKLSSTYGDLYDDVEDDIEDDYEKPSSDIPNSLEPEYKYTNSLEYEDYKPITDTLNPDEIYPNGPTIHEVEKWKEQYKDCYVFAVEIVGERFVCRTISRPEYRALVTKYDLDQIQREELICMTCVLHPYNLTWENIIKLKGGVPSTLASIIMKHSGFTEEYGVQIL